MSLEVLSNIAIISTVLFAIYFALNLSGIELDMGMEDAGVFSFFSIQTVLVGTMTFSWGGLFVSKYLDNTFYLILAAASISILFIFLFKTLFSFLKGISSESGILEFKAKEGMTGKVYLTIAPNLVSGGQVIFEDDKLGSFTLNVINKYHYPIKTGEMVIVEKVEILEIQDPVTKEVSKIIQSVFVKPLNTEYFEKQKSLKNF